MLGGGEGVNTAKTRSTLSRVDSCSPPPPTRTHIAGNTQCYTDDITDDLATVFQSQTARLATVQSQD